MHKHDSADERALSQILKNLTCKTCNPVDGTCTERDGTLAARFLGGLLHEAVMGVQHTKDIVVAPDTEQVKILLQNGAIVDSRNEHKATPLHVAARSNNIDAVSLLVEHGANLEARNFKGATPLNNASREGSAEIVAYLIHKGCDVNAQANDGKTPLHNAVYRNRIDVIRMLVLNGADTTLRDQYKKTATTQKGIEEATINAVNQAVEKRHVVPR